MIEDVVKVIILSLIEGVTEFLPISSTGHLIVGSALLDFNATGEIFEIFIQIGAVAAVIVYYQDTLISRAVQARSLPEHRRFWLLILIAFLPAAALGILLEKQIGELLFSPQVVAISLIAGGVAFLLVERLPRFRQPTADKFSQISDMTFRQALAVGIVQTLALIPGVSRSGSSIIGGMLSGLDRRVATEFSFFLAIPVLGGATVYKLISSLDSLGLESMLLLLLGATLSAVFARLAIDWLLRFISRNSFVVFGFYRIAAGLLILAAVSAGLID